MGGVKHQKDIFVDSNVIKIYPNVQDEDFKKFFYWLVRDGYLIISNALLGEYNRIRSNAIASLLEYLYKNNRLVKVETKDLECIREKSYKYRCNMADRVHVKLVMVSNRKLGLAFDKKLLHDINNFPGYRASASYKPSKIPYKK